MIKTEHTTIQLRSNHSILLTKEKMKVKKLTLYSILHLQKYMLLPSQQANLKQYIYYNQYYFNDSKISLNQFYSFSFISCFKQITNKKKVLSCQYNSRYHFLKNSNSNLKPSEKCPQYQRLSDLSTHCNRVERNYVLASKKAKGGLLIPGETLMND